MRNRYTKRFLLSALLAFCLQPVLLLANNAPIAGFGTSLRFDGQDDFAQIDNYNGPTNDFTIEFWVKPTNLQSGWKGFFGNQPGAANTRAPSMWQNGDKWHCDIYKKDGTRFEVNIPNVFQQTGEWIHLAWVKNGSTMYYYRNGTQIFHRTAPPNGDYKTTSTLLFGKVDNHFDAFFDEVRIWTTARTQQEINEYRFKNLDPASRIGLLHYWPLDEGSGTTINDAGPGARSGTLINGPVWENAASAPPITTPEDTSVSNFLKAQDVDNDPLTFVFTTQPSKGIVSIDNSATGAYTYTPSLNENGTDSFTYKVNDGTIDSNLATINITITPQNDPPSAIDDHYHIAEDGVLNAGVSVLDNDKDIDGDHLSAVKKSDPQHGTLTLNANGTFIYTPNANYNGPDSFTYAAADATAESSIVSVSIRVDAVNDPPVGNPDSAIALEDFALSKKAKGVLANDRDIDGNPLTALLAGAGPSNGAVTLNADGSYTYTPNSNYTGPDEFRYTPFDGSVKGNEVVVKLTVTAVNDPPVGVQDSYTVAEDAPLSVLASSNSLISNDTDVDTPRSQLSVDLNKANRTIQTADPQNGVLTALATDGSFTYVPNTNFNGSDFFEYVVTDGKISTGPVRVDIKVRPTNDAPFASDDAYSIAQDGFLQVDALMGVLNNDSDIDGDSLLLQLVDSPLNGNVQVSLDGSFTYRPDPLYVGTDTFTYQATDGASLSNTATVTITVNKVNVAPLSSPDSYTVAQGGLLTVSTANGLLVNDLDTNGDTMLVLVTSSPTQGLLQMQLDGSFTYKHDGLNALNDSFTYLANDGSLDGNEVTVTINVNAVNHAPLGAFDTYNALQGTQLAVSDINGVLSNDLDIDGDQIIALIQTYPGNGALGLNPDGSFTYLPAQGFTGTDTFTYKALDGKETSAETSVTITVAVTNTPPLGGQDSYGMLQGQALQVDSVRGVLANDIDPDGDPLTVSRLVSGASSGTVHLDPGGGFSYLPTAGFVGLDSFTYRATDGKDESADVVAVVDVRSTNAAPTAVDDSYSVAVNGAITISALQGVLSNDSDPENDPLSAQLVTVPAQGVLQLNLDGSFIYSAPAGVAPESFVYRTYDGHLYSANATVTITVIDDGDGVRAGIEDSAPNGGDGNGDGIPDSQQSLVTSAATSGGYLTMVVANTTCTNAASVSVSPDPGTDSFRFPYGLLSFELPCASADLTVIFHGSAASLSGATYRKFGPTPPYAGPDSWYTQPGASFGSIQIGGMAAQTVTFSLSDGQLGDDTPIDGKIVDAGGPGISKQTVPPVAPQPVPTMSPAILLFLLLSVGLLGASRIYRRY